MKDYNHSYTVIVTADPNDADYESKVSENCTDAAVAFVRKVAAAIKAFKPGKNRRHNWTRGLDIRPDWPEGTEQTVEEKYAGVLTKEEIEDFEDNFMPYNSECEGMHTITQIQIIEVISKEKLLSE